jgi:hypothetical protein
VLLLLLPLPTCFQVIFDQVCVGMDVNDLVRPRCEAFPRPDLIICTHGVSKRQREREGQ